jgi:hypothetical protein
VLFRFVCGFVGQFKAVVATLVFHSLIMVIAGLVLASARSSPNSPTRSCVDDAIVQDRSALHFRRRMRRGAGLPASLRHPNFGRT